MKPVLSYLASGSKGNALYISDGRTHLLVDAGLSGIELRRRMEKRGLDPTHLDGVVITHEHSDHISGAGVMARRYDLPLYTSPATFKAARSRLGKIADPQTFDCGQPFRIGSIRLEPFCISHDASDPAGFIFHLNRTRVGLATDLGKATALVRSYLTACHVLILEANHDPEMLINGPYPWPLKQRIQSRMGHLSNVQSRELLTELQHPDLHTVVLAHLSETNNTPDQVMAEVKDLFKNKSLHLEIASQDQGTGMIYL